MVPLQVPEHVFVDDKIEATCPLAKAAALIIIAIRILSVAFISLTSDIAWFCITIIMSQLPVELPVELRRGICVNYWILLWRTILFWLEMIATKEDMDAYRVPIHCRDYCAHVLIPLNMYVFVVLEF